MFLSFTCSQQNSSCISSFSDFKTGGDTTDVGIAHVVIGDDQLQAFAATLFNLSKFSDEFFSGEAQMKLESFFIDGEALKIQGSFEEDTIIHVLEVVIISHKHSRTVATTAGRADINFMSVVVIGGKDSDFGDMGLCGNRGKRGLVNFHECKWK